MSQFSKWLKYAVGGSVITGLIGVGYKFLTSRDNITESTGTDESDRIAEMITKFAKYRHESSTDKSDFLFPIHIQFPKYTISNYRYLECSFNIPISENMYDKVTIKEILQAALGIFDELMKPAVYDIDRSKEGSSKLCLLFMDGGKYNKHKKFTELNKNQLLDGMYFRCQLRPYEHKISDEQITCPYLLESKEQHILSNCPIYNELKLYVYTEEHLNHLYQCSHFSDEYSQKPVCKYGNNCKSYQRLKESGSRVDDRCHTALFRHPPRIDHITLQQNIVAFQYQSALHDQVTDDEKNETPLWRQMSKQMDEMSDVFSYMMNVENMFEKNHEHKIYDEDKKANKQLQMLIDEVVRNGFEIDLCLNKIIDFENKKYTLMKIVKEKMNHFRHKRYGSPLQECHMLALILYTGCDCDGDLCKSQRNGDFSKWKQFDINLSQAIERLSKCEYGRYKVYSGVCAVKLNKDMINDGYFVTYTSSSWKKEVAQMFAGGEGIIFEMDEEFRRHSICCDVSWISKFDEYEILFSRHSAIDFTDELGVTANDGAWDDHGFDIKSLVQDTLNMCYTRRGFHCKVIDESNGIQKVTLEYHTKNIPIGKNLQKLIASDRQ